MPRLLICLCAVLIMSVVHVGTSFGFPADAVQQRAARPNIVWIVVEDMSAHFGCYGETTIRTPHVDRLAAEGVLFRNAFVTAPVCSTARSALITGMYQTTIGAHHHRSGRGTVKQQRPDHIPLIPEIFQKAGYWTCNGTGVPPAQQTGRRRGRIAKTDYNFDFAADVYDGNDWEGRQPGQPFFAQIQTSGGKGRTAKTPHPISPDDVKLPPYYPDDPVIREDWAMYLNSVMNTDLTVGRIVERLKAEGILDNTYIFFITDHGISHARGKQFCYDEGIRIPFIVRGPKLKLGTTRDDLIVHIDMAATSLALAGIDRPAHLESRALFADEYQPRDFVISARDRCDETVDRIRSVRTDRYKYIRNFLPRRPYLQPNAYKDNKPIIKAMRRLFAEGKLNRDQSLIMADSRPGEELYDLKHDPLELHNMAASAEHAATLKKLRGTLADWQKQTGDQGMQPEAAAVYDSDMQLYFDTMRIRKPERLAEIQRNVALMKLWASQGR
jgi:arylsulfatase A-like enzyme